MELRAGWASEAAVVPLELTGQQNRRRWEGPLLRSRVTHTEGLVSALVAIPAKQDKVRELQRTLYRAAKADPQRRFHALYDKVHRRDVLERAWELVRANRGAAGIDKQTIADVEEYGSAKLLDELTADLKVFPQVIVNVKVREKKPLEEIPSVAERIRAAEVELADSGRVVIRYSGTEALARVMIEAESETAMRHHAEAIAGAIRTELGTESSAS